MAKQPANIECRLLFLLTSFTPQGKQHNGRKLACRTTNLDRFCNFAHTRSRTRHRQLGFCRDFSQQSQTIIVRQSTAHRFGVGSDYSHHHARVYGKNHDAHIAVDAIIWHGDFGQRHDYVCRRYFPALQSHHRIARTLGRRKPLSSCRHQQKTCRILGRGWTNFGARCRVFH